MLYITSQSTECLHVSCITWFPWPPASQARRYQSDVTGEKSKAQSSWETARSLQQISRAGGLQSSLFILSPGPLSLTCTFQAEFGEGPRRSLGNYCENWGRRWDAGLRAHPAVLPLFRVLGSRTVSETTALLRAALFTVRKNVYQEN